jgi:hypothetical protein
MRHKLLKINVNISRLKITGKDVCIEHRHYASLASAEVLPYEPSYSIFGVPRMADSDPEFVAMQTVFSTLEALDAEARGRVMAYVASRLDLPRQSLPTGKVQGAPVDEPILDSANTQDRDQTFQSLAELFDASQPTTNAEKALVAGYWVQVCLGNETFDSQSANKELKHLGDGLVNITSAIDSLKNQKPALALQLRKSGRTQQARKTYKITVAGVRAVENMISGND